MVATAVKQVLISLGFLEVIFSVLILFREKIISNKLGLIIFASLIAGFILALSTGLAEMDWNIIWNLFK